MTRSPDQEDIMEPDFDDIADEVEARLNNETHEKLCACRRWPAGCATYGKAIPWTHSDVRHIVQITMDVMSEFRA